MPEVPLPPHYDELARDRDVDAALAAEARAAGLSIPVIHGFTPYGGTGAPTTSWYVPSNHNAFDFTQPATPWVSRPERLVHRGLIVRVPYIVDAFTTGRVRLTIAGASAISGEQDIAGVGTVVFRWHHGLEPWTPVIAVNVDAIRTAGAGTVYIGAPEGGLVITNPDGCTDTGL